jgi:hypothetical protein
MSWFDVLKFHPDLRRLSQTDTTFIQLGNEQEMKDMWDASNPDMPHEMRSQDKWKYPIEDWYGAIVDFDEDGNKYPEKRRLVSVVGNAVRSGKEGKQFAYLGGGKTHPAYTGKGLMRGAREKAIESVQNMPRVAGFSSMRTKRGISTEKPTSHEVIPDEVLEFMEERMEHLPDVNDWGITKWMQILKGVEDYALV